MSLHGTFHIQLWVLLIKSAYLNCIIGWLWYVYVESFGSLIVALFWAFTVDITTEDSAARGFPIISLFGQTGNIVGPLLLNAQRWGFDHSGPVVGIVAAMTLAMGVLMWVFIKVTPKSQFKGYQDEKEVQEHLKGHKEEEPGFFEGLKASCFTAVFDGYLSLSLRSTK